MTQVDDKKWNPFMEKSTDIKVNDVGIVRFRGQLCVPNDKELKKSILEEERCSKFSIQPSVTKMDQDLMNTYWWMGMKKDVVDFISKCMTCQQVKVDHQLPSGLLKPIEIQEWK